MPDIVIPKISGGTAPTIVRIGANCYSYTGEVSTTYTNGWDDVEQQYTTCQNCLDGVAECQEGSLALGSLATGAKGYYTSTTPCRICNAYSGSGTTYNSGSYMYGWWSGSAFYRAVWSRVVVPAELIGRIIKAELYLPIVSVIAPGTAQYTYIHNRAVQMDFNFGVIAAGATPGFTSIRDATQLFSGTLAEILAAATTTTPFYSSGALYRLDATTIEVPHGPFNTANPLSELYLTAGSSSFASDIEDEGTPSVGIIRANLPSITLYYAPEPGGGCP